MTSRASTSQKIAQSSKSNLAFALTTLSRERKRDMVTFYAFCRVIDDIADEPGVPLEARQAALDEWRQGLLHGFSNPDELQSEVAAIIPRYRIPASLFAEIVDGVESDLHEDRYETYEDLLGYCYKVASVVGLVSIEIFGYQNPACKDYAVNLGYALQLTNILRDVGEDVRQGRIYLPKEDLQRFQVTEGQIIRHEYSQGFAALMRFEHDRARAFYDKATLHLPEEDRHAMLAAEMMAQIYSEILEKLRRSDFEVFGKRIGLGRLRKLTILGAYTARGKLGAP